MDLWHQGYLDLCDGFIITLWMAKNFFGDLDLWFSNDLDLWLSGSPDLWLLAIWISNSSLALRISGSWLYGSLALWLSRSLAPGYMDLYQAEHKSAADAAADAAADGAADAAADGFADAADDAWRLAAALSLEVGSPQVVDVVLGS